MTTALQDGPDQAPQDQQAVLTERRGHVLLVTLNRPAARNAVNLAVALGLGDALEEAEHDRDIWAVIVTGAGDKAFCAGADLQATGAAFATDFSKPNVDYADLLRLSQNATKPSIARVGGVCMAGGMGLLCMTDLAVEIGRAHV